MKMERVIGICFMLFSGLLHSAVFKCKVNGKVIYQHEQCARGVAVQGVIKESSPAQVERDKLKLKTWQEHIASEDAAKKEMEKQRQAELEKQEKLELERRSVAAQERQAIAAQQPQKPVIVPVPVFVPRYNQQDWHANPPPYFNNNQFDYRHKHQNDNQRHDQPQHEMQQQNLSRTRPMAAPLPPPP